MVTECSPAGCAGADAPAGTAPTTAISSPPAAAAAVIVTAASACLKRDTDFSFCLCSAAACHHSRLPAGTGSTGGDPSPQLGPDCLAGRADALCSVAGAQGSDDG